LTFKIFVYTFTILSDSDERKASKNVFSVYTEESFMFMARE